VAPDSADPLIPPAQPQAMESPVLVPAAREYRGQASPGFQAGGNVPAGEAPPERPQSVIRSVKVELESEVLGNVKVRIFGTENALQIQVKSPEWEVRQSLRSGLEDLVQRVERLGIGAEPVCGGEAGVEPGATLPQLRPSAGAFSIESLEHAGAGGDGRRGGGQSSGPDWQEAIRRHRQYSRRR
jgi:hypothetical protein